MTVELRKIPESWTKSTLDELGIYLGGVTYKRHESSKEQKEGLLPVLRANNINSNLNFDDLVYVPEGRIKENQKLIKGDVIICMSSGSKHLVGKAAQATSNFNGGFGAFCGLFRSFSSINSRFVGYFFQSPTYRNTVSKVSKGVNINNLRRAHIEEMEIPLAPLNEQHRIVAKIEELFTQLDAGIAELQQAKARLKQYRQAVLKAAVEGELTRAWREQHKDELEPASELLKRILAERRQKWEEEQLAKMREQDKEPKDDKWKAKYKEPEGPDTEGLPELPAGWVWVKMNQVSEVVSGVAKGRKLNNKEILSLPYMRVANVQQGWLNLETIKEIKATKEDLKKYRLENDDLLLTEGGDWDKLGRSAIWKNQIEDCIHQNHIFRARRYHTKLSPKWLMYNANSPWGRKYFSNSSKQTTNLASINLTQLRSFPFPLPPQTEHLEIIKKLERMMSVSDEVEMEMDSEILRASSLKQAILKNAFNGKLVPQNPEDEPASALLKRIKSEKEKKMELS